VTATWATVAQVNFFMDAGDEREFLAAIKARGDTRLHIGRFFPSPVPPSSVEVPPFGTQGEIQLTNTVVTSLPRCHGAGGGDHAGEFLFDLHRDLHIQFSRCWWNDGALVSGRLFTKIGWLDNNEANAAGRAWYAAIERWIKHRYKRVRNDWWLGPSAEKWSCSGGRLSFGGAHALTETLRAE
jgi:hypothetical protein